MQPSSHHIITMNIFILPVRNSQRQKPAETTRLVQRQKGWNLLCLGAARQRAKRASVGNKDKWALFIGTERRKDIVGKMFITTGAQSSLTIWHLSESSS